MQQAIILVFLLLIYPFFSEAKEISYPTNQVERLAHPQFYDFKI